jgi:acetylglutamate/LysW-gamma-L-alpha-aminoadipate kinase
MPETLVVKCGGHAAVDGRAVCADIAALARSGHRVVLVHGGSAQTERLAGRLRVPVRWLTSPDGVRSRYTDDEMLKVVMLALAGEAKPGLVVALAQAGISAVGLTGLDGGLLQARRRSVARSVERGRPMLVRGNNTGRVTEVRAELLRGLLDGGHVPVVSPPAAAEDGRPVNIDADRVAAAVAAGLGAAALVLLTGAPGVLADPADERSVRDVVLLAADGVPPGVRGGAAMKLVAAREALRGGVPRVLVADGRVDRPASRALGGAATTVVLEREWQEAR